MGTKTIHALENECDRMTKYDYHHNCWVCACDNFYNSADYMIANCWDGTCEHTKYLASKVENA